jgi:hypothetical protein
MMIPDPLIRTEDHVITDLADMIRRDGNRLYGASPLCPQAAYQSSLCGLTAAYSRSGDVLMLKGADLHVNVALAVTPVDDSDGIERYRSEKTDVSATYLQGDIQSLRHWHNHLCAYRRSMRPSSSSAVA